MKYNITDDGDNDGDQDDTFTFGAFWFRTHLVTY
jgi:hypothetical protein